MATWTIATLERDIATGGVLVAHWRASEVDGDYSASTYSICNFTYNPEDPSFIPYDDLTEEMVLGWVWGEVDKAATEAILAANIAEQKNPVTADGVPW